jgi:hypothetical protein
MIGLTTLSITPKYCQLTRVDIFQLTDIIRLEMVDESAGCTEFFLYIL